MQPDGGCPSIGTTDTGVLFENAKAAATAPATLHQTAGSRAVRTSLGFFLQQVLRVTCRKKNTVLSGAIVFFRGVIFPQCMHKHIGNVKADKSSAQKKENRQKALCANRTKNEDKYKLCHGISQ